MKRRELIQKSYFFIAASVVAPQLLFLKKSFASTCVYIEDDFIRDHMEGVIPEGVVSSLSTSGMFHHYHYLHIPQSIVENPPVGGFKTLSSMMIADLGIANNFFANNNEIIKQFHCHEVFISRDQIRLIQKGDRVVVQAYIFSGGASVANHQFVFNDSNSLIEKRNDVIEIAKADKLRMTRSACNPKRHPIRVFHPDKNFSALSNEAGTSNTTVEQLKKLILNN
jgi:hypothetical protein